MLIGHPAKFAIESGITKAYDGLSFLALGHFVLHIGGRRYGVHQPDASLLACSFGEVEDRLARRGTHTAPFAATAEAGKIAAAMRETIYADTRDDVQFFGLFRPEFAAHLSQHHLIWAPDGDEAFDDGSYVLQFDVGDQVRLIAFGLVADANDHRHDPATLREAWLPAEEFYGLLQQWRDAFRAEWQSLPRVPETEDGTET